MLSVARETITKARFFLDRAEEAGASRRDALCNYLEASIVFSRSVTFHLQKEYADRPGFSDWYAREQVLLRQSRLSRFLLEQRNYVLKEGQIVTHRVMEMAMTGSIHISGSASIEVVRGAPWYKRSIRVLWDDITRPLRSRFNLLRVKGALAKAQRRAPQTPVRQAQSSGLVNDAIYFSNDEWRDVPAIMLVRRLLDDLDVVVSEAEQLFGFPGMFGEK